MKDTIKLLLELFKLGRAIYGAYRKAKDAREKKKIKEAVEKGDLDALRRRILGRS